MAKPKKYNVGFYRFPVEIPELDALIADVIAAFEKHGVGIEEDRGWGDERDKINLCKFEDGEWEILTNNLENATGLPWIDAAVARAKALRDENDRVEREAKQAQSAQIKEKHDAALLERGLIIGGKRYRLVEVEFPQPADDSKDG